MTTLFVVASCGLSTKYKDESDLDEKVRNNYNLFRQEFNHRGLSRFYHMIKPTKEMVEDTIYPDIEFVGVWDTVDAYGFPIDEMTYLWDKFIFPIRFPDQKLSAKVQRAKHALSVDDERHTFHPIMWDESSEMVENRIEQVWFSGMHSDVGGGYAMNNLSLVSLDWMISKVEVNASRADGLQFIPQIREEIHSHTDWHGIQHDSRAGAGAYYRYKPRMISDYYPDVMRDVDSTGPKIHESVLERIKGNVVTYAPLGLPVSYEVVTTDDKVLASYESKEEAASRVKIIQEAVEVVGVRKRLYYAFVLMTLVLLASRFFLTWNVDGSCENIGCILTPLISIIPDFAATWLHALAQNPVWLIIFGASFGFLVWKKMRLWEKMRVETIEAWSILKDEK